ncbi:glycosyltransferase family 1 protein [uncultured Planktosalinus sp.]|uniref:glycosyltransferase family 4 protein n=1 Tax=uncultured Planktosalinus sp. TaxID=1810935 RepID=UPI0030D794E9
MRPLKIAIIADALDNQNAGVHVFTKEMIRAIIKTNTTHEILLIRQKKEPKIEGVKEIIVKTTKLPIGYASFRLFCIIPFILVRQKVDIVIEPAHFGPFNLPSSIKRVTVIHDLTPILFPEYHRFFSWFLQKLFLGKIIAKADLLIANSNYTKQDILKHYTNSKDKVVKIYPDSTLSNKNEHLPLKVPFNFPYFLTVGTIEPRKNHLLLLEAFEIFKKNNPEYKLIIAGAKGWKSNIIYEKISNHTFKDDIIFTGFVDNETLCSLYQNATAMIYPSKYEGFGFPVLESIRLGTIPILTNNSSLPEVGSKHAFYIQNEDPLELSKVMQQVATLKSEEREIIIQRLKQHAAQFSWQNFGNQIWEELIILTDNE